MRKWLLIIGVVVVLIGPILVTSCSFLGSLQTQPGASPVEVDRSIALGTGETHQEMFYAHAGQFVTGYIQPMTMESVTFRVYNPQKVLIFDQPDANKTIRFYLGCNTDGDYTMSIKSQNAVTVLLHYQIK